MTGTRLTCESLSLAGERPPDYDVLAPRPRQDVRRTGPEHAVKPMGDMRSRLSLGVAREATTYTT